ncbi:Ti-type conjugative transfer relaxase TraA [Agrobacterium tumefaciens]|uniref:Ti-type conjugative transfer relaxase TraA n=1 Tax=Agrobacterium tumefaciens TaxID=358 RepID=UPI0021FE15FA|nr:Ti-type conjugative transfer relaxase TraA [Agrobacterium tumefaciens]
MAIYHCSMKPLKRRAGRSSVAAAAYRSGTRLVNASDGIIHDYSLRRGIEHAEIVLPEGVSAAWAQDRQQLWNRAEAAENRKDARTAREVVLALPHELNEEQREEAVREFAKRLASRYGVAIDFAIHAPGADSDKRNFHAHLLLTTRVLQADGFGEKTDLEGRSGDLVKLNKPTTQMQIRQTRVLWEEIANFHLARAGFEERIDHRSHSDRGLEIEPTKHMGVHAHQMQMRGIEVERGRQDADAKKRNAALIAERPEEILDIVTGEKSVFDRHDIARALNRYIDDPEAFQNAFAKAMASPELVKLRDDLADGELARYSTKSMIEVERSMAESAMRMAQTPSHGISKFNRVRHDLHLRRTKLNVEQIAAVKHVTGPEQISAVIGLAGAGKSTMLNEARALWEKQGYRVHGAALSGIAAEGLQKSAGIQSRTLASWEMGWKHGKNDLQKGDVLVIDEAGMVSSRQLATFIEAADRAGAKVVLVGDPEQLQPINAGAAFRALLERIGYADIATIQRQRHEDDRKATVAFGKGRTAEGLNVYAAKGAIRASQTRDDARADLVERLIADRAANPEDSRIALAHTRKDVRAINDAVRADRAAKGELSGEVSYQTNEGKRSFAAGDRLVFLENNPVMGVKNGLLGTVEKTEANRLIIRLDSEEKGQPGRVVTIPVDQYAAFDHGYATTIHKSQGATVDRAFVLASGGMDRHLTYVAMTRHRQNAEMFMGYDDFADMQALSKRLSRNQSKETTLDYLPEFVRTRGIERDTAPVQEATRDKGRSLLGRLFGKQDKQTEPQRIPASQVQPIRVPQMGESLRFMDRPGPNGLARADMIMFIRQVAHREAVAEGAPVERELSAAYGTDALENHIQRRFQIRELEDLPTQDLVTLTGRAADIQKKLENGAPTPWQNIRDEYEEAVRQIQPQALARDQNRQDSKQKPEDRLNDRPTPTRGPEFYR